MPDLKGTCGCGLAVVGTEDGKLRAILLSNRAQVPPPSRVMQCCGWTMVDEVFINGDTVLLESGRKGAGRNKIAGSAESVHESKHGRRAGSRNIARLCQGALP